MPSILGPLRSLYGKVNGLWLAKGPTSVELEAPQVPPPESPATTSSFTDRWAASGSRTIEFGGETLRVIPFVEVNEPDSEYAIYVLEGESVWVDVRSLKTRVGLARYLRDMARLLETQRISTVMSNLDYVTELSWTQMVLEGAKLVTGHREAFQNLNLLLYPQNHLFKAFAEFYNRLPFTTPIISCVDQRDTLQKFWSLSADPAEASHQNPAFTQRWEAAGSRTIEFGGETLRVIPFVEVDEPDTQYRIYNVEDEWILNLPLAVADLFKAEQLIRSYFESLETVSIRKTVIHIGFHSDIPIRSLVALVVRIASEYKGIQRELKEHYYPSNSLLKLFNAIASTLPFIPLAYGCNNEHEALQMVQRSEPATLKKGPQDFRGKVFEELLDLFIDPKKFEQNLSQSKLFQQSPEVAAMLYLLHTEREEKALELEQKNQELEMALQRERDAAKEQEHLLRLSALGEASASLAHEMKSPLAALKMRVEMMQNFPLSAEKRQQKLSELMGISNTLLARLQHMQDFSRRQADLEVQVEESLSSIWDNVMLLAGHSLRQAGVKPDVEIPEDLPGLWCHPLHLEQLFLNLVNNARDAMEDGEEKLLTVRAHQAGERIQVCIQDTGVGMDEETRQRLFERFFTTKAVGRGTGLGMQIVQKVLSDHDGVIEVASEPGKGTLITVSLPIGEAPGA